MSDICGTCLKYTPDEDYPPGLMGECADKCRPVAYNTISECGKWEPNND